MFPPPSDAHMLAGVLRDHAPGADVLDVCTGSGYLAVCAALAGAHSVTAVDVSRRATLTARVNGALNGTRVRALRGDLLDAVRGRHFDVIVSNPPYLPAVTDRPTGLQRATEAGPDGRLFVDRLIDAAPDHLRPGGTLLIVHSSINGTEESLARLERVGLEPGLAAAHHGPLGPILTARAPLMERRGLIAPSQRDEDIVIVRGRVPVATV